MGEIAGLKFHSNDYFGDWNVVSHEVEESTYSSQDEKTYKSKRFTFDEPTEVYTILFQNLYAVVIYNYEEELYIRRYSWNKRQVPDEIGIRYVPIKDKWNLDILTWSMRKAEKGGRDGKMFVFDTGKKLHPEFMKGINIDRITAEEVRKILKFINKQPKIKKPKKASIDALPVIEQTEIFENTHSDAFYVVINLIRLLYKDLDSRKTEDNLKLLSSYLKSIEWKKPEYIQYTEEFYNHILLEDKRLGYIQEWIDGINKELNWNINTPIQEIIDKIKKFVKLYIARVYTIKIDKDKQYRAFVDGIIAELKSEI